MVTKKHKRKINHVVILTSDAVDAHVKQFRIRPWLLQICIIGLCIIIGGLVGFVVYEEPFQTLSAQGMESDQTIVEHLEEDKKLLEAEIVSLNSKIEILRDTINKKVVEEMDLIEKFEKQSTPLLLPLAGSAKLEEISQEEPSCIFSGVEGTTIIATGTGTVKEIIEDEIYGTKVTIEHDNGYESIYQNNGNVLVKVGDTIMQGAALFVVTADNATLKYSIKENGQLINPMDVVEISG